MNAVRKLVMKRFYWSTITSDIKEHIRGCVSCQRSANRNLQATPALQSVSVPNGAMRQVGVDLIQMPPAEGYSFVIVLIDYFSKWVEAQPLPDKTAKSVADFLYSVICRHGCFKVQINDQGREFVNQVSKALHEKTGTQQKVTSAYHPQANGLVERQNQTIKKSIVKVLEDKIDQWPDVLEGVLFALRVKVHESTGFSPFFLLYNREPVLPVDVKYTTQIGSAVENSVQPVDEDLVDKMLVLKRTIDDQASKNISVAQKKQKMEYDARHSDFPKFKNGDLVLVRNLRREDRKGDKMSTTWRGPYKIGEIFENGTCSLQQRKNPNELLQKRYSLHHIKRFHVSINTTELMYKFCLHLQ